MKRNLTDVMHPKLVRDKIPDRIRRDQRIPVTREALPEERLGFVVAKLCEEARELHDNPDAKEYADVLDVVRLLRIEFEKKFDKKFLGAERRRKKKENGGFRKFIILVDIQESSSV